MLAASQKRAEAEIRGARPGHLGREADGGLLVQLSPGALRPGLRDPDEGRRARPHRVPRLRARARVMALFKTHGFDPKSWPRRGPRAALAVTSVAALAGTRRGDVRAARAPRRRTRVWVEKNCYVDVWIEVLHALGLEPLRVLPFVLAIDFEGDQLTFFKPPHEDLVELYGVDVQELNVWRPLVEHVGEQLARRQARPHRGGRVLPARHGRHRLPAQHTQDDDRHSGLRRRTRSGSATFTTQRTTRSSGEDFVGALSRRRAAGSDVHAALRGARSRRPRGRAARRRTLAGDVARAARASTSRGGRPTTRSRASARASRRDLPCDHGEGLAVLSRVGVRDGAAARRGVRARCDPLALARGSRRSRRPRTRSSRSAPASKTFILKAARAVNAKSAFDAPADVRRDGRRVAERDGHARPTRLS